MNASIDWMNSLGSLAVEAPVKLPPSARDLALDWAAKFPKEYHWITNSSFDFALKMRDVLNRYGQFTPGQLAAVQKCMNYEQRLAAAPAAPADEVDLRKVPPGMYAVPDGDTRLKVRIEHGEGKWHGWVFVKDAAAYGSGGRYGTQRPVGKYQGKIARELAVIAQDPRAASAAYGRLVGRCGVCGRHLEDAESVARGIGPVCASRF